MRFGAAIVVGSITAGLGFALSACAADGLDDGLSPDDGKQVDASAVDATANVPARDASPDRAAPADAGVRDATAPRDATADVRDATPTTDANDASDAPVVFDAAPDVVDASYDPTGAACAVANAIETRQCGRCGYEKRLCRAEDGGTPTWLAWGPCQGEKAEAGYPNTVVAVPCEKCGTKEMRFDSQCNASVGFCVPAAGAECEKRTLEWASGLSCGVGLGRYRTCTDTCKWDGYGTCTAYANPNVLTVGPLASADAGANVVTGQFSYEMNPKARRLIGYGDVACPITNTIYPESTDTAFAYVEVKNPTAQTVTVELWHSASDTQMAVYAGSAIPENNDDVARRACLAGTSAADNCPTSLADKCGQASQYSTAGIVGVKVAPNSSITVWNALRYAPLSATPFTLSVRTTAVE